MRPAYTSRWFLVLWCTLAVVLAACSQGTAPASPTAVPDPRTAVPTSVPSVPPTPVPEIAPTTVPTLGATADPTAEPATEPPPAETVARAAPELSPAAPPASGVPPAEAEGAPILFTRFGSSAAFASGTLDGSRVDGETVALAPGAVSGTWVSPVVDPGFPFKRLVSSWSADTPGGSWIQVEVQATTASDTLTDWYGLGVWADDDHAVQRTSVNNQRDADARVATDTLLAVDQPLVGYRLRVTLERPAAEEPSPTLRMVGAVVADGPSPPPAEPARAETAETVELSVPTYSQLVHAGHYPQWAGGGSVWCSPTSTQMVVEYWGEAPSAEELAWIEPGHPDPYVDFAARRTFDAAYGGTGNWSFNTAYAARYGLEAFVTQLRSLDEAERFIQAGIPLVASVRVGPGDLDGFLSGSGPIGHLLVVIGFDQAGNPIVNDPLARSNGAVRRVYDRAQFERVWLGGSGGIVYVIHPQEVPLPSNVAGATANW